MTETTSDKIAKDGRPESEEDVALSAAHYNLWRRGKIDDPLLDEICGPGRIPKLEAQNLALATALYNLSHDMKAQRDSCTCGPQMTEHELRHIEEADELLDRYEFEDDD